MTKMEKRKFCQCKSCQSACQYKPGWMKFGDEVKIANHLKVSVKTLFKKYLLADWWSKDGQDYYGLSPAIVGEDPGQMFPFNPKGVCVFFKNGKCSIHAVAPFECQVMMHTQSHAQQMDNHRLAAESWDNPKAKALVKGLLGQEPAPPVPTLDSIFSMLFS